MDPGVPNVLPAPGAGHQERPPLQRRRAKRPADEASVDEDGRPLPVAPPLPGPDQALLEALDRQAVMDAHAEEDTGRFLRARRAYRPPPG